jgi:hypothetical protein
MRKNPERQDRRTIMTTTNATNDTPAGLDNLLRLFHSELAAVQFPGVDARVLDAATERVHEAACEVRRCEAELEVARALLADAQEEALQKGRRALAYARVYAQDTPDLLARLDAVAINGAAATPSVSVTSAPPMAPRRRGRPPKSASVTPLFGDGSSSPAADETAGDDRPDSVASDAVELHAEAP